MRVRDDTLMTFQGSRAVSSLRVAPPGFEPGSPNPELTRGGLFGGHHVRKW